MIATMAVPLHLPMVAPIHSYYHHQPSNQKDELQLLELYAIITGEYDPPPHIDFTAIASNAMSTKGDVFLEELKTGEERVSAGSLFYRVQKW